MREFYHRIKPISDTMRILLTIDSNLTPMTIWIVSDQKTGHQNQSIGLSEAILNISDHHSYQILPVFSFFQCLLLLIGLKKLNTNNTPSKADIILGAGHRTHWSLLALKLKYNAFTVVLMKPSLPKRWFNLCVIPEHDGVKEAGNVLITKGAINRISPSDSLDENKGLILIGGESKHYQWDNQAIIAQLTTHLDSTKQWTLTTSRRTPNDFRPQLKKAGLPVEIIPFEQTDAQWLPDQLQKNGEVWVTPDSVSMIYEALSSGAKVSIFQLIKTKANRINQSIDQLVSDRVISKISQKELETLTKEPLYESNRIAKIILERTT